MTDEAQVWLIVSGLFVLGGHWVSQVVWLAGWTTSAVLNRRHSMRN